MRDIVIVFFYILERVRTLSSLDRLHSRLLDVAQLGCIIAIKTHIFYRLRPPFVILPQISKIVRLLVET